MIKLKKDIYNIFFKQLKSNALQNNYIYKKKHHEKTVDSDTAFIEFIFS